MLPGTMSRISDAGLHALYTLLAAVDLAPDKDRNEVLSVVWVTKMEMKQKRYWKKIFEK